MVDKMDKSKGRPRRRGHRAQQLVWVPHDFCPGDADAGKRIAEKGLDFGRGDAGVDVSTIDRDPHSFAWLRDLRATDVPDSREHARRLIEEWIAVHGNYDTRIWAPPVMAERVVNWIAHFQWYGGDDEFRAAIFDSLQRQVTRLRKTAKSWRRGVARVRAAKGLIYAATCVPGFGRRLRPALDIVERELNQHIMEDGGVFERSPGIQFQLLRDLVEIRTVLAGSMSSLPPVIDQMVAKLTPLVKLVQHTDGTLAQFNGTWAGDPLMVAAILKAAPDVAKVPSQTAEWGFHRLQARDASVIVDAGPPPVSGFDSGAHAGTLGIEFCAAGHRLIVNTGVGGGLDRAWREACRATAAHSTLVVADTNSAEIQNGRGIGRRPRQVAAEKVRSQGIGWTDFNHDGYAERFRLLHRRRLSLAADGRGLFGEDRLETVGRQTSSSAGRLFAVRFHLHPDVAIGNLSSGVSGSNVSLTLEGGEQWLFSSEGAENIELDESIYFGGHQPRRTKQIVLSGRTNPDGAAYVMWSMIGKMKLEEGV